MRAAKAGTVVLCLLLVAAIAAYSEGSYSVGPTPLPDASPLSTVQTPPPAVETAPERRPIFAEIILGYGNRVRSDLSADELERLYSMFLQSDDSQNERSYDESSFMICFYFDHDSSNPDYLAEWRLFEGGEFYDEVAEIYNVTRIIPRTDEDIQSALQAAKEFCAEVDIVYDKIWYDQNASSAWIIYMMSRGGYERGEYQDGSTYDSWDEEPDTMYIYYYGDWAWENGHGLYQLGMHRIPETGEWNVGYQGMPPPFVERSSPENNVIVYG